MTKYSDRKLKIFILNIIGIKQNKLAKIFDLSKQRISNIINNYKTIGIKTGNDKSLRKKIFDYCFNKCVICKSKKCLQIHHIDNNSRNNDFENLVILCSKCHYSVHKIDREEKKKNNTNIIN